MKENINMETKNTRITQTNQEIERIFFYLPTPVPLDSLTIQLHLRERYNRAPKKLSILYEIITALKNNCTFKLETIANKAKSCPRHVERVIEDLIEFGLLNKAVRFMKTTVFKISNWFFQPEIKCWFKNWLYNNLNLIYLCLSPRKMVADRDVVLLRNNKEEDLNKYGNIIRGGLLCAYAAPIMTITSWRQLHSSTVNKSYVNISEFYDIAHLQGDYGTTFTVKDGRTVQETVTVPDFDALFSYNRRPASIPHTSRLDYEAPTQEHSLLFQKQEAAHERIQSDTRLYPEDNRTEVDQVGADQAHCFFRTGRPCWDSVPQDGTKTTRSLCPCIFCSAGLQQSQQPGRGFQKSGFLEGNLQDACQCADVVDYGYGTQFQEVFD